MKKELPGIFKKDIDSRHTNNKKICYASESEIKKSDNQHPRKGIYDETIANVDEKIKQLFKSSRYIFNINVLIKTDKKDYDTKIAGKVKNSLVTVDNEVIPIIDINDIIIKDRI